MKKAISIAEFRLPFPPSVNNLFPGKARRYPSKEYKAWKIEAAWTLKQQRIAPIRERVIILIYLDDKRQGDCANREKAVTDVLVACGVLQGDQKNYVKGVYTGWEECPDCRVVIYSAVHSFGLT